LRHLYSNPTHHISVKEYRHKEQSKKMGAKHTFQIQDLGQIYDMEQPQPSDCTPPPLLHHHPTQSSTTTLSCATGHGSERDHAGRPTGAYAPACLSSVWFSTVTRRRGSGRAALAHRMTYWRWEGMGIRQGGWQRGRRDWIQRR
jgi:hypothetical protein